MHNHINTPSHFRIAREYADQVEQQSDPFAFRRALARLAVFGQEAIEVVGDKLRLVIE